MKYCTHCGKQVLDDAIICPGCGCSVQYGNNNGNTNGNNMNKGSAQNNNNAQQQQHVPPAVDSYSGMSIAGLILSFMSPLIGLILSIIANNEAKRLGSDKSQTMSKAGIIISAVILGIAAVVVIIYIIFIFALIGGISSFAF